MEILLRSPLAFLQSNRTPCGSNADCVLEPTPGDCGPDSSTKGGQSIFVDGALVMNGIGVCRHRNDTIPADKGSVRFFGFFSYSESKCLFFTLHVSKAWRLDLSYIHSLSLPYTVALFKAISIIAKYLKIPRGVSHHPNSPDAAASRIAIAVAPALPGPQPSRPMQEAAEYQKRKSDGWRGGRRCMM
jgi:hypothetical protein